MNEIAEDFNEIRQLTQCNEVVGAILVLAKSVREASAFSVNHADNFGCAIAGALKNVLENSEFKISPTFGAFDEIASAIREGLES